MAIVFHCACGKKYSVPEAATGKRARCGACRTLMDVPAFVPVSATTRPRRFPVTHEEKVALFLEDMAGRGVGRDTAVPPVWRAAWDLGLKVPPPISSASYPWPSRAASSGASPCIS